MANVGFKLGLQSALDALIAKGTAAGAIDGSFYLTSDTNRLYIGKADGSVAPVNEGVTTVANVASLPIITEANKAAVAGQFYYATAENILCVYNGKSWVQINSVIKNTGLENAVTADATSGGVKVQTSVSQNSGDASATVSDSFTIVGQNGIKVESTGTAADPKITISGDSYTLSSDAADNKGTITLGSEGNDSAVTLAGGTNVTITKQDDDLVIASKDTKVQSVEVTERTAAAGKGFEIKVVDTDGTAKSAVLAPEIIYGEKGDMTAEFESGTATLNVPTKDEVEAKIANAMKAFNAMEYQGTIGTTGTAGTALPNTLVKNGYSYLLSSPLVVGNITYPAGTLVIAQGTEDEDGYIPAGGITWSYVTGSSADTTYYGSAIANGLKLLDSSGNNVAQLTATAGTDIEITSSTTDGSAKTQTLTVNHKAYTTTETEGTAPAAMGKLDTSYEIPVISAITTANGHVTGYETKIYKVLDTNASLDSVANKVEVADNTATITNTVTLLQSNGSTVAKSGAYGITSDNLTVTASGSAVAINMVWGTF